MQLAICNSQLAFDFGRNEGMNNCSECPLNGVMLVCKVRISFDEVLTASSELPAASNFNFHLLNMNYLVIVFRIISITLFSRRIKGICIQNSRQ